MKTTTPKSPFVKPRRGSKAFAEDKAAFIELTAKAPKAKKTRSEKILDEVEASGRNPGLLQDEQDEQEARDPKQEIMLEGLTETTPGIWVPSESVTDGKGQEILTLTSTPETLATDLETTQADAEKEYGEKTLEGILSDLRDNTSLFNLLVANYEVSVVEAMFRRLTKSGHKVAQISKSTFVAKDGGVGPTKRVWEIAGEMKGAKRSEVLARCLAEGIGINTAKTQYQKFMEAGKNKITGNRA